MNNFVHIALDKQDPLSPWQSTQNSSHSHRILAAEPPLPAWNYLTNLWPDWKLSQTKLSSGLNCRTFAYWYSYSDLLKNSNIRLRTRLFNTFKKQVRFFRHETFLAAWALKKYEYALFMSLSTSIYRLNMSLLLHSYGHYFLHVCGRKSQGGSLLGVKRWSLLKWGIVKKSDGRWLAHLVAKKVGVP